MLIKIGLALAAFAGLALTATQTVKFNKDNQIAIEYYYSVSNDKDGDFIMSQLIPELNSPSNSLLLIVLPYGGVQIITDDDFKYYCHGKNATCETSLIHYCVELNEYDKLAAFLSCYFQSELYPTDTVGASRQCIIQLTNESEWAKVDSCAKNSETLNQYAQAVLIGQMQRPVFDQTPHIFLNEDYSSLAAIDLKKALCRVKATDPWQCESVDRYKEPLVEIFYTVYQQEASDFFSKQLTQAVLENVVNTVSRLDLIPNPNKVVDCDTNDATCWSHQAHYCIFENFAGSDQLEIIQCTFGKADLVSAKDRVQQCVPENKFQEITNCIDALPASFGAIKALQAKLNQLIGKAEQQAVEVLVKEQPNSKVKNGVLQELCYNYFHDDNETWGCKVSKKSVQIYYETQSKTVNPVFEHFYYAGQYAPWENAVDFEFIPYGNTKFENGNYTCANDDICHANWIHACLFKRRYSTAIEKFQFIQFFLCATEYIEGKTPTTQPEECVNQIYKDGPKLWGLLVICAHDNDTLKEEMATKTQAVGLAQVPEITMDGEKITEKAGNSLLTYICQSFDGIKPRVCFDIDSSTSQTLQVSVFLTGDQSTQTFVQSQIKPLLASEPRDVNLRLRDAIEWQFVPWGLSKVNPTTGEVECPNTNECLVNRILSCATKQQQNGQLGIREDRQRVASFVVCFFDSASWQTDPLNVANQCNSKLSTLDNFPQLWQCVMQKDSSVLFEMQTLTENNYPAISKFPAVTIYAQQLDLNLVDSLCPYYTASPAPVECANLGTTVPPQSSTNGTTVEPPQPGSASSTQLTTIMLTLVLATVLFAFVSF